MILKPTTPVFAAKDTSKTVFLAGSINNGQSLNWQEPLSQEIIREVQGSWVFNPRRDDWDASWKQSFHNKVFRKQVEWEIHHLNKAETVFFYFAAKGGMSPISLYELGYLVGTKKKVIVYSEKEYPRLGNLEVYFALKHFDLYVDFGEAKKELFKTLNKSSDDI